MNMQIRPITDDDKVWVEEVIKSEWGTVKVVTRGKVYQADELPGFVAEDEGKKVGLITYHLEKDCEIISLNSFDPGKGIGTGLVERVKEAAVNNKCGRVWLITTNDNTQALKFYQKRGFALVAVYPNAVAESRKLKPEIPEVGIDGIPLRDEIELEIKFS
jgi:N-acetylglutamate synthase-like GNAT family acetyltransferase